MNIKGRIVGAGKSTERNREGENRERKRKKRGKGQNVQSTRGVYVSESELRVLRLALVMPQVVMLGHILETQRGAVFGEAEQRGKESGVQVDVIANVDV